MRLLLDEDVPVQVLAALRQILHGHSVEHVDDLGWKSKKDLALFHDAASRGYQALITNDKNQLENPDECGAIRASGMHHIRYAQDTTRGKEGLGLAMASLLAAAHPCIGEIEAATAQRIVRIRSITPHHRVARYDITDPIKDPPTYWPRSGPAPRRPRRT